MNEVRKRNKIGMEIDGCMTENCQNYLSLEVVQNEKSMQTDVALCRHHRPLVVACAAITNSDKYKLYTLHRLHCVMKAPDLEN